MDPVRQRILDHAHQAFLTEGPASVSLNRLCRELHIAKKTFYVHFDNKDDLVRVLVEDRMARYAAALVHAPGPAEPPDVRLRSLLTDVVAVSARSFSSVYLRDLEAHHPELWARLSAGRHAMLAVLHGELVRGQQAGVFRADAEPDEVLAVLTLVVDRVLDPSVLVDAGLEPHRVSDLLFGMLFRGVLAEEPAQGR